MVAIRNAQPPDPRLEQPAYFEFLLVCIAGLSLSLGHWLGKEAERGRHPAISFLSTGFFAQAILFAAEALAAQFGGEDWSGRAALLWFSVLSEIWVILFSFIAALALQWRKFRHWLRDAGGNPARPGTRLSWAVFCGFLALGAWAAIAFPQSPPVWSCFIATMVLGAGSMGGCILFYRRRNRPVLLPLIGGLFVFLLSQISAMLSAPWHLLWWCSHLFYFCGLMLVGYGVLEGHRFFEREEMIARLAELTSQLEEQSVRDPLTGIFNRRHAMAALESEFKKAQRGRLPLAVVIGDLDNFKQINDTYGHMAGDQVLRETARRLAESVRESDIVARCGGEEFWILLPLTNRIGGREVANKTLEAMRERAFLTDAAQLKVTMSMGIADTFSPGVIDVPSLVREADRALYAAKRAGKDRAAIVDPLAFSVPAE